MYSSLYMHKPQFTWEPHFSLLLILSADLKIYIIPVTSSFKFKVVDRSLKRI